MPKPRGRYTAWPGCTERGACRGPQCGGSRLSRGPPRGRPQGLAQDAPGVCAPAPAPSGCCRVRRIPALRQARAGGGPACRRSPARPLPGRSARHGPSLHLGVRAPRTRSQPVGTRCSDRRITATHTVAQPRGSKVRMLPAGPPRPPGGSDATPEVTQDRGEAGEGPAVGREGVRGGGAAHGDGRPHRTLRAGLPGSPGGRGLPHRRVCDAHCVLVRR